jgi:hypothetical protein
MIFGGATTDRIAPGLGSGRLDQDLPVACGPPLAPIGPLTGHPNGRTMGRLHAEVPP